MCSFKPGDVVRWRGGGPLLTVDTPEDDEGLVVCSHELWFEDGRRVREAHSFPPYALEFVREQ